MIALPSALLCGTIRDGGLRLEQSIARLVRALSKHFSLEIFIVESDSSDKTVETLQRLKSKYSKYNFAFEALGNLRHDMPNRLVRLAHCRNSYLDHFKSRSHEFEYLITADLDGINSRLSAKSLDALWENDHWDAAFANQSGPYYDIGALRVEGWIDSDPFVDLDRFIKRGFSPEFGHTMSVTSRMLRIPKGDRPVRVDSAYGGLGIYRTEAAISSGYTAKRLAPDVYEIEIVSYNQQMSSLGYKLFILPSMVNAKWTEHTVQLSTLSRVVYVCTKSLRKWLSKVIPIHLLEKLSQAERRLLSRQ